MRRISVKEIQNVVKQDARKRYKYFLNIVADHALLFGLKEGNGWRLLGVQVGEQTFEVVPFWPTAEYARLCATDDWCASEPTGVDVHEFIENWIPEIINDQRQIAVFPTPEGQGALVDPERLKNDLLAELARVE